MGHHPPLRWQGSFRLRHPHADRAGAAGRRLSSGRATFAALSAALALAGCGGPAELTKVDAETLQSARERLDDALETAEIVRTDKREAAKLVREVRRYGTQPARLVNLVPSLVTVTGNVYPPAYRAFVDNATTSSPRALFPPAAREVERMISTLDGKDAETVIATLDNQTATAYLAEAARDTRPIWPNLSRVLKKAREEL